MVCALSPVGGPVGAGGIGRGVAHGRRVVSWGECGMLHGGSVVVAPAAALLCSV